MSVMQAYFFVVALILKFLRPVLLIIVGRDLTFELSHLGVQVGLKNPIPFQKFPILESPNQFRHSKVLKTENSDKNWIEIGMYLEILKNFEL